MNVRRKNKESASLSNKNDNSPVSQHVIEIVRTKEPKKILTAGDSRESCKFSSGYSRFFFPPDTRHVCTYTLTNSLRDSGTKGMNVTYPKNSALVFLFRIDDDSIVVNSKTASSTGKRFSIDTGCVTT